MLGEIAEVNDLMAIGQTDSSDQTQGPEQEAGQQPAIAVVGLLRRDGLGQAGTDQMGDQHQDEQLEIQGDRAAPTFR